MAKKNSKAPKKAMIFNSVLLITAENVVSFVKSLPKTIMTEEAFNSYMERNFYFGGKFHGNDFNSGSHYSTIVRQLGLYHILNGKYIPRFTNDIDVDTAEKFLKYWLKLYIVPNPTSQPSLRKSVVTPKYVLKEIISFLESNPNIKDIYKIVDIIFQQELSRNDKGNLANILNRFSDCIEVNTNFEASLTANYKNVMEDINALINDPNRYFEHFGKGEKNHSNESLKLQQIFYGAPGTGKSYIIKKETEGESVIRTTFHPDSDYSTFVGCYKPTMVEEDAKVIPVVVNKGISLDDNKGTYKEKRISYQFVKQAFLKAYLGAWKKYAECSSIYNNPTVHEFNTDNGRYVINSVGAYGLTLSREFQFPKSIVQKEWGNLWKDGIYEVPKGPQTGKSVQHAIANWIFKKIDECTIDKFDEGWKKLVDTVKKNGHVDVQKTQTYIIRDVAADNETLTINVEARDKKRVTLQRKFNEPDEAKSSKLEKALINILKCYNSDFDDAWELLKQDINNGVTPEVKAEDGKIEPQFLVIEEINRGNCAQIFGDIFQLLDRASNGFSVYPIEADSDLREAIKDAFSKEEEFKLSKDIDIDGVIEYSSNFGKTLSDDIQEGRVLLLPPNLYIWATMNTSDQSLFPIDSAFKRRWDWVYMPIGYKNDNWTIEIGSKEYKWVNFQRQINDSIYGVDNSEDKKLGDYFVNANRTGGKISADTFLNKILFYIWNDVCKDDPDQIFQWIKDNKQKQSIKFSDFFGEDRDIKLQGFMAFNKVPAIGEPADTDNSDDKKDPDSTETDENPIEDDNDLNS